MKHIIITTNSARWGNVYE